MRLLYILILLLVPNISNAQTIEPDHWILVVTDLEKSIEYFRDYLGFTIKMGTVHSNSIRNAHIKFQSGPDIELMTADSSMDDLSTRYRQAMKNGGGIDYLAFGSSDINNVIDDLREHGYPLRINRGSYSTIIDFKGEDYRNLFFIQLDNPPKDKPEIRIHNNGALGVFETHISTSNDNPQIPLLRNISEHNGSKLAFGSQSIIVDESGSSGFNIDSLSFQVEDIKLIEQHFLKKGVDFSKKENHLEISLGELAKLTLRFVEK